MSDPQSDTVQGEVADVEDKEDDRGTENADKIRADSNETEDAATPVEVSRGRPLDARETAIRGKRYCVICKRSKDKGDFSNVQLKLDAGEAAISGRRYCVICKKSKDKGDFSSAQLKRVASRRACRVCIDAKNTQRQPLQRPPKTAFCLRCVTNKDREHFSASQLAA